MRLLPTLLLAACACAQAQTAPFAPVAWLAGCWAQQGPDASLAGSAEQWMAPAGGLMLGMARIVEFEFMQMRADADQLVARIEGEMNGKARGIDFAMQRTPCP